MYKWRDNVLLVGDATWFLRDERAIPYSLIKRYLRAKDAIMPLPDLTKLMTSLDGYDQSEIAVMHPALETALEMRPVFMLYKRFPSILSPQGMPLDSDVIAMLHTLPFHKAIDDHSLALRLTQQDHSTPDQKILLIRLEIEDPNNHWSLLGGFAQNVPRAK